RSPQDSIMKAATDELIPTRHSLLRRMKNWEDQASWEEFFETYWKLIYGVAIKAGLRDVEAQDVVQETVMTVAKNIKEFEIGPERGSFKAWLLTNTRWRIIDQYRKRQPLVSRDEPSDDTSCTPLSHRLPDNSILDLDTIWDQEWKKGIADAALANLRNQVDPEQYQMFDLH